MQNLIVEIFFAKRFLLKFTDPGEIHPMEKKIGSILIVIEERETAKEVNETLSQHANIVLGRQGLPLRAEQIHVISLVVEADMQQINALSGQLGKIRGVQVKTVVSRVVIN